MRARLDPWDEPAVPPPVRAELTDTLTPENLSPEHLETLTTALTNVLQAEVAQYTYSEIIDGLPTFSSFVKFNWPPKGDDYPILLHKTLCTGAVDKYQAFRTTFSLLSLKFEPQALQGFQDTTSGSRAFNLRLLELVAVACHQIAALLFQPDGNKHMDDYAAWVTEQHRLKAAGDERYEFTKAEPPVPFYHGWYRDHEQYPRGPLDMVGYWAEDKILGGVLLFDRGESGAECHDVFFHGGLFDGPHTIYPPTPEQLCILVDFLTSDPNTKSVPCPLPIEATKLNRPRYHRYHATKYFNIFRNRYDSRLPEFFVRPDKFSSQDFPEIEDNIWLLRHTLGGDTLDVEDVEAKFAAATDSTKNITPSSPLWGYDEKYR